MSFHLPCATVGICRFPGGGGGGEAKLPRHREKKGFARSRSRKWTQPPRYSANVKTYGNRRGNCSRVYRVQLALVGPVAVRQPRTTNTGVMRRNPAYAETRTVVHYCDSKRRNERAGINDRLRTHTYLSRARMTYSSHRRAVSRKSARSSGVANGGCMSFVDGGGTVAAALFTRVSLLLSPALSLLDKYHVVGSGCM